MCGSNFIWIFFIGLLFVEMTFLFFSLSVLFYFILVLPIMGFLVLVEIASRFSRPKIYLRPFQTVPLSIPFQCASFWFFSHVKRKSMVAYNNLTVVDYFEANSKGSQICFLRLSFRLGQREDRNEGGKIAQLVPVKTCSAGAKLQ